MSVNEEPVLQILISFTSSREVQRLELLDFVEKHLVFVESFLNRGGDRVIAHHEVDVRVEHSTQLDASLVRHINLNFSTVYFIRLSFLVSESEWYQWTEQHDDS
jgi:hypothetical protein